MDAHDAHAKAERMAVALALVKARMTSKTVQHLIARTEASEQALGHLTTCLPLLATILAEQHQLWTQQGQAGHAAARRKGQSKVTEAGAGGGSHERLSIQEAVLQAVYKANLAVGNGHGGPEVKGPHASATTSTQDSMLALPGVGLAVQQAQDAAGFSMPGAAQLEQRAASLGSLLSAARAVQAVGALIKAGMGDSSAGAGAHGYSAPTPAAAAALSPDPTWTATSSAHVTALCAQPPHMTVILFVSQTLLALPPSALRQAHMEHAAALLSTAMLNSSMAASHMGGSAPSAPSGDSKGQQIQKDVQHLLQHIMCLATGLTQQAHMHPYPDQSVLEPPTNAAHSITASSVCMAPNAARQAAAHAFLAAALDQPSLGQVVMYVCAQALERVAHATMSLPTALLAAAVAPTTHSSEGAASPRSFPAPDNRSSAVAPTTAMTNPSVAPTVSASQLLRAMAAQHRASKGVVALLEECAGRAPAWVMAVQTARTAHAEPVASVPHKAQKDGDAAGQGQKAPGSQQPHARGQEPMMLQQAVACMVSAFNMMRGAKDVSGTPLLEAALGRAVCKLATALQHLLMSDRAGGSASAAAGTAADGGGSRALTGACKAMVRSICKQLQSAMIPR